MGTCIIQTLDDAEQVSRRAAKGFVHLSEQAIVARGRFTVALAGGSTPRRMYELLAEAPFRDELDWQGIEFFWGDERAVPPDHPDSNFRMASETMLQKVPVLANRIHRMEAERLDRDAAASDYEAEIARIFVVPRNGEPPALDLVLLGLGADGHTASLFPSTAALNETARWVVANHVPKLAAYRVTLTARMLNQAACVMFLVGGADKADAVAEVLEGSSDPQRLPAQLIRPTNGALFWLLDRAAAGRLLQPSAEDAS